MRRWIAISVGLVALALSSLGFAVDSGSKGGTSAAACGRDRWAVKTLTDARAKKVNFHPKTTAVRSLRSRKPPRRRSLRIRGVESSTYRVPALLVAAKIEGDHDIHLVIADPTS